MLEVLETFRNKLDDIMLKAMGKRVVLYGYDRTGQFLEWYAEYYHSIKMDFIITTDWSPGVPRNFELFSGSLLEFHYKDVENAIVWLAVPEEKEIVQRLTEAGYQKGETWFSFLDIIYGKDYLIPEDQKTDVFFQKKAGKRDIQFMEWLEYQYDCNFVNSIQSVYFEGRGKDGRVSYVITTQKEIFPILDKCHCIPQENDAIFDFGCGKGGAMVSFLDYGFRKVGGVEYEKKIFDILTDNFHKLGIRIDGDRIRCIHGDAVSVREELDEYNWFYYFEPFKKQIFIETIKNIAESLKRKPRRIHILNINPYYYEEILNSGYFVLTNQFWIAMRQKVVDVFVTKREFEK